MKPIVFVIILFALTTTLAAQWLKYPTPGIPRTANGKPNLAAPAPRTWPLGRRHPGSGEQRFQ